MRFIHSLKFKLIAGAAVLVALSTGLIGGYGLIQFTRYSKNTQNRIHSGIKSEAFKAMKAELALDRQRINALVETADLSVKRLAGSSNMEAYINAAANADRIARAEAARVVHGLADACRVQQDLIQDKVDEGLLVAEYVMDQYGRPWLNPRNPVAWQAVNQYTKNAESIQLPRFMIGELALPKSLTFEQKTPVVDETSRLMNMTCTIFQRMNPAGDILRAATSVKKLDGTRAVGTFIPAVNPDGTPNPVVSTIMAGETYRGRAYVVNAWYITAYQPIYGRENELIGVLYVGVKQKTPTLAKTIVSAKITDGGYSFVMDSDRNVLIHPEEALVGQNAVTDLGLDALATITLPPDGQTAFLTLERQGVKKLMGYTYFADWDWLICTAADWEDLTQNAVENSLNVLRNEFTATYRTAVAKIGGREVPLFDEISYYNEAGYPVIRLVDGEPASARPSAAEEAWFKQSGRIPPGRSLNLGVTADPKTGQAKMRFVTPVYGEERDPRGLVSVELDWSLVRRILDQSVFGHTGYAFVVNDKGRLVSHPQFNVADRMHVKALRIPKLTEILETGMLAGESGQSRYTYEGVERFLFYTPLEIGGKGYSLAAALPVAEALELARRIEDEAGENFRDTIKLYGLFLAFCFLLTLGFGVLFSRMITKPITRVVDFAKKVSAGDFTETLEVENRDEIGVLMNAINDMIRSFRKIIQQVQRSGIQVSSSATELAAGAKEHERTIDQQVQAADHALRAVENISADSDNMLKTMENVSSLSQGAADMAGRGQADLDRMGQAMEHLEKASLSISDRLGAINQKTENITEFITTMAKVADQTNLLSLNAAIEAEKAGEYGIGFAVVAREVRRLADQTEVAALDIERTVKEMRETVSDGVNEMDRYFKQVSESVELVGRIGEQLTRIIEQIQVISPSFDEVKQTMSRQSTGAREINDAMDRLNTEMRQVKDALKESFEAIDQLRDASQDLQKEISVYKS